MPIDSAVVSDYDCIGGEGWYQVGSGTLCERIGTMLVELSGDLAAASVIGHSAIVRLLPRELSYSFGK